ncbi:MAG: HNH endonuclease [Rhizobiaceae bacterium]|nr:HNH endonuclease [Rhizobiaceae bacterium]MCV0406336.1 HNH endonuclease [Rhizobiaceae bacterium]
MNPARRRADDVNRTGVFRRDTRIRGRKGQELRKRRLQAEPLCRHCKAKGFIRASTVPDHIIPLKDGGEDVDSNIQCLCDDCHEAKTAKDMGYRKRVTIGADGWPLE